MTAATTLLVDLDGTLTDNYPGISRSIIYALERMGHPPPGPLELRRCVGPPLRLSFARILETEDAEAIEQAIALYRERFGDIGWRENIVYDGIADMMPALTAAASRMFLCTSKPDVFARRIVTLFGLDQYFTGVYGVDLAGVLDDKVKLIAHLAARESVALEHAIMIGDREHDVRAARMNGARSIGVLWGYGSRRELAAANAIVVTPAELPGAVTALGAAG